MTTLAHATRPSTEEKSPFDAIKQTRQDGSEFWSARDLMEHMGYSAWRNFEVPLERAMRAAVNQNIDVTSQFAESRKLAERSQGGGNTRDDYHLSRFAAYLVTMNGDPNKAEVALEQNPERTIQRTVGAENLGDSLVAASVHAVGRRFQVWKGDDGVPYQNL